MRNQKLDPLALKVALEREQTELFGRLQSEFWQGLFCDILKKHTYQNEFYFVESNLTTEKVVEKLNGTIDDLFHIYGLESEMTSHPYRTEIKLKIDYFDYQNKKSTMDELSIIVCQKDITMRILPHNPLLKLLYEASCAKNRNLVQRNLYSSMLYKGRMIRIFHRDFMNDPSVLKKELERG